VSPDWGRVAFALGRAAHLVAWAAASAAFGRWDAALELLDLADARVQEARLIAAATDPRQPALPFERQADVPPPLEASC